MFKKIFLIFILILVLPAIFYLAHLPDTTKLKNTNPTVSAIQNLREKQIRKKGRKPHSLRTWRSLDQISPSLRQAVVLMEDDTFFQHNGFDFKAVKQAIQTNWKRKRYAYGASTLTQQLARTLYLSTHKNLLRKLKEALITRRLEKTLPKKRILELYLNVVEWGPQVYGAEAASQYYFHKSAIDLTPQEAISLAVILPSPRRWNPLIENGFMGRRKKILYDRMVKARYIIPAVSSSTVVSPSIEKEPDVIDDEDPNPEELGDENGQ